MSTDRRTRVRAGEPSAFAELFDSCARTVHNHAFRLTADWATAKDVRAATFMEARRLRDRVDPERGSLRLWLLGRRRRRGRDAEPSRRAGQHTGGHVERDSGVIKRGTVTFTGAIMKRAIVDGVEQTPSEAG
ncbi:RNA polymerase sigma factor [Streptomyces sp. NPDC097727]|uniref:RNA polymerase sigma factor n=1 Tax=Streptomyces sp. NPDC097727 TaxID=3366092 RepID=UPI0037F50CE0